MFKSVMPPKSEIMDTFMSHVPEDKKHLCESITYISPFTSYSAEALLLNKQGKASLIPWDHPLKIIPLVESIVRMQEQLASGESTCPAYFPEPGLNKGVTLEQLMNEGLAEEDGENHIE